MTCALMMWLVFLQCDEITNKKELRRKSWEEGRRREEKCSHTWNTVGFVQHSSNTRPFLQTRLYLTQKQLWIFSVLAYHLLPKPPRYTTCTLRPTSQQHNVHSQILREVPQACLCPFQFIFQSRTCDRKDNPALRHTWQKCVKNKVCNTHTWLAYSQHMFLPHPCLHRQPPPLPEKQPRGSTVETQKPVFRHYEHCYSRFITVQCIFIYSVLQHYLEIGI